MVLLFIPCVLSTCTAPTSLGCLQDPYKDPTGTSLPVLSQKVGTSSTMSVNSCISLCCKAGYVGGSIAGVENGNTCYCDNSFGPYTIPTSTQCTTPCSGNQNEMCGGRNALNAYSITQCPGSTSPSWWVTDSRTSTTQQCGAFGCTICPEEDLCCIGKSPDAYKVAGGFGVRLLYFCCCALCACCFLCALILLFVCSSIDMSSVLTFIISSLLYILSFFPQCSPPNNTSIDCASGGTGTTAGLPPGRCCCGPGPSMANVVNTSLPIVLIVGDSVSAGYTPFVRSSFQHEAVVLHGPDNVGGGMADGVSYGQLCTKYFVRTPTFALPPWNVITFNYGLHDGSETNSTYLTGITSIANQLMETASLISNASKTNNQTKLIYFSTTHSDGGVVPGQPITPGNQRVLELNAIATKVMQERNITVVDLFETMTQCGSTCNSCNPHCNAAGYQYLVEHAIVPAIQNVLNS